MKSKNAFTLLELLIVVAIFAVMGGVAYFALTSKGFGAGNYSEGSRVGIVSKFASAKGKFNKSGEGTLNVLAGIQVVEQWNFSVTDAPVAERVEKAKRSGQRVELVYEQKRIKGFSTDTDYIVTGVNFLDSQGNILPEPAAQQ